MNDAALNNASTEEILASIRKIMSAEWEEPSVLKPVPLEEEEVLELTKKVSSPAPLISKKETPGETKPSPISAVPLPRNQAAADLLGMLLKPLLKEWLDQHLPRIIEKELQKKNLS